MRSLIRNYMGMIAIAVVAVLVMGAIGVRIDRDQEPDPLDGISATPAISGNAPNLLVDVQWLSQYRSQVDYIYDLSDIRQYEQGHIPGAQHIDWRDAMRLHTANYGEPDAISNESNPDDVFGNLHLNVPQSSRIVVYDSNHSERASWLVWVMTINGYTDVHVLDGGLQAWIGTDGELSTETIGSPADELIATPTWNEDVLIRREQVQTAVDDPTMTLVDTRSAEEQEDTVNGTIREGHIPGAVNIQTADVMHADGTFKSPEELQQLFASHSIESGDPVVIYSLFSTGSGPMWIAFHHAGYDNVKVYIEGYVAWGYNQDLPIETAPFPSPTPLSTPVATPQAESTPNLSVTDLLRPFASPAASPGATPEDGPADLTGN